MTKLSLIALCLAAGPALANPVQVNHGGDPAQAQVYGSGLAAAARSSAAASSASHSSSTAQGGTVTNTVTVSGGSSGGGYGGHARIPPSSPTAPDVYGGSCVGKGTSGAATTPFFGLSLGGNDIDRVCQLHMIGQDAAAKEYLCHVDKDMRAAFQAIGQPCSVDQPQPVLFEPAPWCVNATEAQRRRNPASCGG